MPATQTRQPDQALAGAALRRPPSAVPRRPPHGAPRLPRWHRAPSDAWRIQRRNAARYRLIRRDSGDLAHNFTSISPSHAASSGGVAVGHKITNAGRCCRGGLASQGRCTTYCLIPSDLWFCKNNARIMTVAVSQDAFVLCRCPFVHRGIEDSPRNEKKNSRLFFCQHS